MRRLGSFGLLVAAAALVSATPSCERRSLVLIDVQASAAFDAEPVHLQNVRLTVTANRNLTTRFPPVRLSTTQPYQIGVYLPPDMTGPVTFDATIDDGTCVWGVGSADAPNVQGGDTTPPVPLPIEPTGRCVPIGSTGTAGAGGMTGTAGTGGMTGAAGGGGVTGAAGVTGLAGSSGVGGGAAGASGRGGVTGTAGIGGAAGTGIAGIAGRGGVTGTGGNGAAGTLGTAGIGGMTGAAGRGGVTGTAGIGGMTGLAGSGPAGASGRGGTVGTAGNLGTGGTAVCICADPNRVCDPFGACVCAQSPQEACLAAGIQCGNTTNNCGESVFCDCLLPNSFCQLATGRCLTTCVSGTGGPITTEEAKIICPDQPTSQ
jgi:hypothetical protein